MTEKFTFDVRLWTAITVTAKSEADARRQLRDKLEFSDCNFGSWENGDPILAEAYVDREAHHDLMDVEAS